MKKRIILIIIILVVSLILFIKYNYEKEKLYIPHNAVVYTDEQSVAMLKDERYYKMTNLVRQEVYLVEENLNVDFWFSKNATQNQIESARSFTITRFVMRSGKGSFLGTAPYVELIQNKQVMWKEVICRIYIGDKLLFHEIYDENGMLIN